ncbi:MAG: carboxypeptidase-like regulatory domain-containing protein [bacterium]
MGSLSHAVRFGVYLVASAVAFARVGAQDLHGSVIDSVNRRPIAGAVVTLVDSSGTMIRRQLTDQRGEYRVAMDETVRRMRVVRIGFRPRDISTPRATSGSVQLDVVMVSLPTLLEPVRVTAGASCSRRADRADANALLGQARAGLATTVVARETTPARMIRLQFIRHMRGNGDQVENQEVRIDASEQVKTSFVAVRTATDFVRLGFRRDNAGTQEFFGPDADVLLDDGFTDGYCFHISDPVRERPNQIGLAFVPANRRKDRIDIEGALWIDTVARELRDIEFRYVGVDSRYVTAHAGGRISFRALDNGIVMIDRWFFRLIGANTDTVYGRNSLTTRASYYVRESGGEVAHAAWTDGTTWQAPLGTLHALALDRAGKPMPGVKLRLDSTDYEGTTDAHGVLEIPNLLPGPYTGIVADSLLEQLGIVLAAPVAFTAERGKTVNATFTVPTATDYVRGACAAVLPAGADPVDPNSVWLIGRVVDSKGAPVKGVRVALNDETITGSNGLFYFCRRLSLNTTVRIRTRRGNAPEQGTEVDLDRPLVVRTIIVPPQR